MRFLKKMLKNLLKGGVRIGYSSGKIFDPHNQIRTNGLEDIIKRDKKRKEKAK